MSNGWTGGQYSLFRAVLGLYLAMHCARLLVLLDAPWSVELLLAAGVAAGLLLMVGSHDRAAAAGLACLNAYLAARNPEISRPTTGLVVSLLLAHACMPGAPYGAWRARGRIDPRGGWNFPPWLFLAAWVVLSLTYAWDGYCKLGSPAWRDGSALAPVLALPAPLLRLKTWSILTLELLFAPLALFARARPWLWLSGLALQLGWVALLGLADVGAGLLLFHGFTFDPAWLPGSHAGSTDRVFYDGSCGLCHRAVRFFLAEDRAGSSFRYAPLESESAQQTLGAAALSELPDSIVIVTARGEVLTRSAAMLHAAQRLGGTWKLLARLSRLVPDALRDRSYDWIARNRRRFFARPGTACPILPPDLRARFDA